MPNGRSGGFPIEAADLLKLIGKGSSVSHLNLHNYLRNFFAIPTNWSAAASSCKMCGIPTILGTLGLWMSMYDGLGNVLR